MAATAVGLTILGLLARHAVGQGEVREMVGRVVAVEPNSRTIVMDAPLGKTSLTVGAEVPEKASITAGKVPKGLSDIKAGDKIRMRWVREKDIVVVQSIALQ